MSIHLIAVDLYFSGGLHLVVKHYTGAISLCGAVTPRSERFHLRLLAADDLEDKKKTSAAVFALLLVFLGPTALCSCPRGTEQDFDFLTEVLPLRLVSEEEC